MAVVLPRARRRGLTSTAQAGFRVAQCELKVAQRLLSIVVTRGALDAVRYQHHIGEAATATRVLYGWPDLYPVPRRDH